MKKFRGNIVAILLIFLFVSALSGCVINVDINESAYTSSNESSKNANVSTESVHTSESESSKATNVSNESGDNFNIPNIESISGETNDNTYFSSNFNGEVLSVEFYNNGTTEKLSPKDAKVVRLMNFIGYAMEKFDFSQTQGQVGKEYYDWKLDTKKYVTLKFDDISNPHLYYTRCIINDNGFMAIIDGDLDDDGNVYKDQGVPYAIWYEPYACSLRENPNSSEFTGSNLLTYCGF